MAEDRTFTLVGNFTDNITPKLNAINLSIGKLTDQMTKLRTVTQPLKNDFKELAADSKLFSDSLNRQVSDLRAANAALRAHANELGRVNRAYNAAGRAGRPMPWNPPGGGGGGGGAGGGTRGGGGGGWGTAVGASVLGNQLASVMTGAIVRGFQIGTNLMNVPFNYFMKSFSERVRDESSDIQTAGGLLAISQRKNLGMFDTFQSAVKTQQDINYRLAQSAAALPGATTAYVQQGKRISDSIMTAMGANAPGMQKFAEDLGAKQGDKLDALGVLIQKFTEKSVLLGQGSQYRGAYGVPQLVEMLMNAPNVNERMFQRFAVYRDMPILQSAFRDMQKDLAKTGAYTQERMRLVFRLLDQALPNEVIQAHKNSMAGFLEAFKSAFLDPEVGLFGLGRRIKDVAPKVDQYGKIIEKNGKAVTDSLSLYTLIQQTLTGFGLPLSELATLLPQLYEPFAKIIPDLVNLRNVAQQFYYTFNRYTKDYEIIADRLGLGTDAGRKMKSSAGARGALTAIANLLVNFDALSATKFTEIANKLKSPDVSNFLGIAQELLSAVFNSKVMEQIGQTIGSMVGGTLSELGSLMGGVTGSASTGPFAKGLKAGWEQAEGTAGIAAIFRSLFKLILEVMKEAITKAPLETTALAGAMLAPSLISGGLTMGLGGLLGGGGLGTLISGGAGASLAGWLGALGPTLAPIYTAVASLAQTLPPLAAAVATFVVLGGGFENTFRQLIEVSREFNASLGGIFSALGSIFTTLIGISIDGVNWLGRLIGVGNMVTSEFDLLKGAMSLVLIPIQLVEAGLKGLATLLAQLRLWNLTLLGGTAEEKAAAQATLDAAAKDMNVSRGRANVYYSSLGGVKSLQEGRAGALTELNIPNRPQWRVDELKGYLAGVNASLKGREPSAERALTQTIANTGKTQLDNLLGIRSNTDRSTQLLQASNFQLAQISSTLFAIQGKNVTMSNMGQNPAFYPMLPAVAPPAAQTGSSDWTSAFQRAWGDINNGKRPPGNGYAGSLGDAISREMMMKPPGSNLVIANSSETIIPAARGLGMKDFMNTLDTGFNRVAATVAPRSSGGSYSGSSHVTNHISIVQQPGQDAEELAAIVAMRIGEAVAEARSASIFI